MQGQIYEVQSQLPSCSMFACFNYASQTNPNPKLLKSPKRSLRKSPIKILTQINESAVKAVKLLDKPSIFCGKSKIQPQKQYHSRGPSQQNIESENKLGQKRFVQAFRSDKVIEQQPIKVSNNQKQTSQYGFRTNRKIIYPSTNYRGENIIKKPLYPLVEQQPYQMMAISDKQKIQAFNKDSWHNTLSTAVTNKNLLQIPEPEELKIKKSRSYFSSMQHYENKEIFNYQDKKLKGHNSPLQKLPVHTQNFREYNFDDYLTENPKFGRINKKNKISKIIKQSNSQKRLVFSLIEEDSDSESVVYESHLKDGQKKLTTLF